LDDIPSLRPLLHRYVLAHFEQVARTGACNGRQTSTSASPDGC
jgi:hypothetical protein